MTDFIALMTVLANLGSWLTFEADFGLITLVGSSGRISNV